MLATLPMYDFPEVRDATDAFWAAIAKEYGVSGGLTRNADWTAAWRNPDLLFSQTCGYPFTHEFKGILRYVATPHYTADGCEGPNYCSIIFARESKPLAAFRGSVAAINNRDSMSGMLALQLVFAPFAVGGSFFQNTFETGGHVASLQAVQSAKADVCATDCVTVAYLKRYRPAALSGLVEVGRSPSVPGLPFITRYGGSLNLRIALDVVLSDPDTKVVCEALMLSKISELPAKSYGIITTLEVKMLSQGGLTL
jgi:ABC-type phosphate/phosphonate transport system substrate-binding protein